MANILLGVTGSVAAVRIPSLFPALRESGHQVKVVATVASLYFFDPVSLAPEDPANPQRNRNVVILDEDEWPGRSEGKRYQRGDEVLHIELRRWADLFLIAPLDANTLAKLACGLCDNCLTCVWRAWDTSHPVVLAPAMNTLMWENPLTDRHLRQLAEYANVPPIPNGAQLKEIISLVNRFAANLRIVPPQSKLLACGDVGVGAMSEVSDIIDAVNTILQAR